VGNSNLLQDVGDVLQPVLLPLGVGKVDVDDDL